jgi:hypothetical protein
MQKLAEKPQEKKERRKIRSRSENNIKADISQLECYNVKGRFDYGIFVNLCVS